MNKKKYLKIFVVENKVKRKFFLAGKNGWKRKCIKLEIFWDFWWEELIWYDKEIGWVFELEIKKIWFKWGNKRWWFQGKDREIGGKGGGDFELFDFAFGIFEGRFINGFSFRVY